MPMKRKPDCGVCGSPKVEQRGRLICKKCSRRYALEARKRHGGPFPITAATRSSKKRYRNKIRPSGLTNQKVFSLRKLYGITEAYYIALLERQNRKCAVCSTLLDVEALVDHNHETGVVRGLLCRPCNFGIGLFNDDASRLRAAAAYVERANQLRILKGSK